MIITPKSDLRKVRLTTSLPKYMQPHMLLLKKKQEALRIRRAKQAPGVKRRADKKCMHTVQHSTKAAWNASGTIACTGTHCVQSRGQRNIRKGSMHTALTRVFVASFAHESAQSEKSILSPAMVHKRCKCRGW